MTDPRDVMLDEFIARESEIKFKFKLKRAVEEGLLITVGIVIFYFSCVTSPVKRSILYTFCSIIF